MDSGCAPGHLRRSLAWARREGLLAPQPLLAPGTDGSLPVRQALTAEIVKTIRDIIALNPLYRWVSGAVPRSWCVVDPRRGPAGVGGPLSAAGVAGRLSQSVVLIENPARGRDSGPGLCEQTCLPCGRPALWGEGEGGALPRAGSLPPPYQQGLGFARKPSVIGWGGGEESHLGVAPWLLEGARVWAWGR